MMKLMTRPATAPKGYYRLGLLAPTFFVIVFVATALVAHLFFLLVDCFLMVKEKYKRATATAQNKNLRQKKMG